MDAAIAAGVANTFFSMHGSGLAQGLTPSAHSLRCIQH